MNKTLRFMYVFVLSMLCLHTTYAQTSFFWKSISAAEDYTLAVRYDGTLWAWGRNNHGQLGDGTTEDKNVPTQIGTDNDWMQVSAKGGHTVAVKTNGHLYSWGKNDHGQLGNGTTIESHVPARVGTTTWKAAYAGDGFTIALSNNPTNSIWGWGTNAQSQLGVSATDLPGSLTPVQIIGPRKQITATLYTYPTLHSFSVANGHIVALLYHINGPSPALPTDPVNKNIVVWGGNNYAQLSTGNTDLVANPLIITDPAISTNVPEEEIFHFEKVTTSDKFSIFLKRDGSLWASGTNTYGEILQNPLSATNMNTLTKISGTDIWIDIEAGKDFVVAIKSDGTLWAWGNNDKGQLGDEALTTASWQPVQEANHFNDWELVKAGDHYAVGVRKNGSVWVWGDNGYSQLELGHQIAQNKPVMLPFSQFPATFEKISGTNFPGLTKGNLAWGDYDNDGNLDVFITGSAKTTSTANRSELWRNNGDNTFTKVETAVFQTMSNSSASWIDYDNDGFLDIFLTGSTASNRAGASSRLYKNNGDGTFTEHTQPVVTTAADKRFPGIWNNATKPAAEWADFNNDGFIDVVLSGGTQASTTPIAKLYKNNGNGTFTEIATPVLSPTEANPNNTVALPTPANSTIIWIDYDGDGYKDLVIEGKSGGSGSIIKLYKNNGNETFTEVATPFFNVDDSGITWGDYNNDGYPDVVVAGKISGVEYTDLYKNNGDGTFTKLSNTGLTGVSQSSVVLIDFDADGLQDIVLGGYIGNSTSLMTVQYFKNNGDDTFEALPAPFMNVKTLSIAYADINKDGKPDLLIGGHNNTEGTTNLYLNITSGSAIMPSQPQNLAAILNNENKLQLSWVAPVTISGTAKYNVRLGTSSGANDLISGLNNQGFIFANNQQPSHIVNITIDPAKTYYYSVQAVDAAGNKSDWSPEYVFTAETLPVSLENFTVQKENDRVKISWSILSESNSNRFEIERAGVDGSFITIATEKSKVNNGRQEYYVYDYNPLNGINYYQLKQYDNDGSSVDYGVKNVNFEIRTEQTVKVYPNPVRNNEINLALSGFSSSQMSVVISDISGRLLHQQQLNVNEGTEVKIFPSEYLQPGIYIMKVSGENFGQSIKLLVQ